MDGLTTGVLDPLAIALDSCFLAGTEDVPAPFAGDGVDAVGRD